MQNSIIADLKVKGLLEDGLSITTNSRFGTVALAGQLASTGWQVFLLAFFLAYLVMAAQFNSWRYPLYLLMPVPLALVGALFVTWLVGGGLDIFGLMGMLMLIGLSAKNAILYLDFVVERIDRMPLKDALVDSARLRFRPIVMTTLTVLVISVPLVFSTGQGAEFGQRMGIVMFGGIVFSAVLTFFLVPAAFFAFEGKREGGFNKAAGEIAAAAAAVQAGKDIESPKPGPSQERSQRSGRRIRDLACHHIRFAQWPSTQMPARPAEDGSGIWHPVYYSAREEEITEEEENESEGNRDKLCAISCSISFILISFFSPWLPSSYYWLYKIYYKPFVLLIRSALLAEAAPADGHQLPSAGKQVGLAAERGVLRELRVVAGAPAPVDDARNQFVGIAAA